MKQDRDPETGKSEKRNAADIIRNAGPLSIGVYGDMAIFIPPYMGEEIKSNAEKKMYEVLQGLSMEDAYILHSLGLPKHQSKIYGEVDFVIVCRRGVACLEIKGGRVECRGGKWFFIDRYGVEHQKPEGPFAQVIGNMFSLLTEIKARFPNNPHIKQLLVASGVVLPDITFHAVSQEMIPEIVYDNRTENITDYINRIFDYWEKRHHREPAGLSKADVQDIVHYLRSDFTFVPTLGDRLDAVEKRLVRLTHEQAQVMNALGMNEHLLVEGNAGTGKTLLAIEHAKRCAERGERVLYLTFNKNLAHNINIQLESEDTVQIRVINIHALFGKYIDVDIQAMHEDPQKYFGEVLPEAFFEYVDGLNENERDALQYDVLVMDEGQDIIKPLYLYSLDQLLRGGLENGKWVIFYDEKQNIYNPEYRDGMEIIESYFHTKFKLFVNCRNTVQIGTYCEKMSGVENSDYLQENGEEVQCVSYSDTQDFKKKIKEIMKFLNHEKIRLSEVAFLAPKKYENSILREAEIELNELGEYYKQDSELPMFATIQGFKGLDAKIVILVDIDNIHKRSFSQFFYIAATRARTLLYVVGSETFWKSR